ncbi:MAG: type II toxin-antitoxin system RelE/ParE family toxin [Ideonella sp.]|nr:type II toxin-antitoxin system RelE/ParE family toxin [Ideonella sp.]MCC7458160.1 type II toxin-antitoxin system RelE/ParE family toxin [Nitrospira sp.]
MAQVNRRPQATLDILDIWDHIAEDNLDAADRWVDEIGATLELLATQPLMGRARPELAAEVRSHPFRRYVIFYLPMNDGIDVVRVLHSARDVDTAFHEAQ